MPSAIVRLSLLFLLSTAGAQSALPVTEDRLQAAYAEARAACAKVLHAELDDLPLQLVDTDALAKAIAAENLPAVRLREPDPAKAEAAAAELGRQLARVVYAKYAWADRTFLVVRRTWEDNARLLRRPALTGDQALRAVMVHELCHAIDDRRFPFAARLSTAGTADAIVALNAVIEGHAQLQARRVCQVSGWVDGFATFTDAIGAIAAPPLAGEATMTLLRGQAAAMQLAYVDGERFAAAVLAARPATGAEDLFGSPPLEAELIQHPDWYLDPKSRPKLLWDPEPALDDFGARFDPGIWTATRVSPTGRQLASGLTLLPPADVESIVGSLRSLRTLQLTPTAAPQSRLVVLVVMEFDSDASARRWVELSGVLSDRKDETMDKGMLRIVDSATTKIERDDLHGLLQHKSMRNGRTKIEVASLDVARGPIVIETIFSSEPPADDEHLQMVVAAFAALRRRE